ncbi:hypothetical protein C8A00DRAFT_29859, partial [Chaetomidium leptoderma]
MRLDHLQTTEATAIQKSLEQYKLAQWGFVIFRCTYGSQEKWDKFVALLKEHASESDYFEWRAMEHVHDRLAWTIIQDAETLDGADIVETIELDEFGETSNMCWWGRKKTACCKVDAPSQPPTPGGGGRCIIDYDWCSASPKECAEEQDDAMGFDDVVDEREGGHSLTERGAGRDFGNNAYGLLKFRSRGYPSRGEFIKKVLKQSGTVAWWGVSQLCDSAAVKEYTASDAKSMPDKRYRAPNRFSPTSPDITNPVFRLFEAFGSNTHMGPLSLADRMMNQIKGKLIGLGDPLTLLVFKGLMEDGARGDTMAAMKGLSYIQGGIAVFNYLQQPGVSGVFHETATNIRAQFSITDRYIVTLGAPNLANKWDEFFAALLRAVPVHSQQWLNDRIWAAIAAYNYSSAKDGQEMIHEFRTTVATLQAWNPWLGADCDAGLFANLIGDDDRAVCVRVGNRSGPATTTTSATSSGSVTSTQTSSSTAPASSAPGTVCISGSDTGNPNQAGLCSFACHYGYCPAGP